MDTELRIRQLGESVVEGTVGKWLKSEGEWIKKYEPLLEVITDKVDTEITAPDKGYLLQIYVQEGETVQAGRLLAYIGEKAEQFPAPGSPQALQISSPHGAVALSEAEDRSREVDKPRTSEMHISPAVARIAVEHNVQLNQVTGTGRAGRVTKKDILRFIEVRDTTKARDQKPGELLALTSMRKAIAEHMVRSVHTSPHASTIFEIDCSRIVAHRAAHKADYAQKGAKLTFTAYFVQAAVVGLKAIPVVNSVFTNRGIQLKREINIGVAVAVEEGLMVPVIKAADERPLLGIARELNDLAQRAREKKLRPDEVQGGTFTITNHGVNGSLFAAPIINQPQAAILGVGMIQKRVVVLGNDAIAVRPMVYLSLTFDHRIMDGAVADQFMSMLKQTLEAWS